MSTSYITTWFYREKADEASYYPQVGGGASELVQSVYMQIQVPFFTTFRHYNPHARLIFFTNLDKRELPAFLLDLFAREDVEVKTLPYTCKPPKGWYGSWMNQFYLYDILAEMGRRMADDDTLIVSDADCLCHSSLTPLCEQVRAQGSAFYKIGYPRKYVLNGTSIEDMEAVYQGCFGEHRTLNYYGGEFIALRGDVVRKVNALFPVVAKYNFALPAGSPRLHEEAHTMAVIAGKLGIGNEIGNGYVKRMWTARQYNNIEPADEQLAVWHMPAEKNTGLYRLYRYLQQTGGLRDEQAFWQKAKAYCGVPTISTSKKIVDLALRVRAKIRMKLGY